MVDRYIPMYAETATDRYCQMLQSPTGSFVLASDYDALAAELAEAKVDADTYRQERDDVVESYKRLADERDALRSRLAEAELIITNYRLASRPEYARAEERLAEAERVMREARGIVQDPYTAEYALTAIIARIDAFIAADSASVWPGPYGLCADGQPHIPRPLSEPLACGRCGNELTTLATGDSHHE